MKKKLILSIVGILSLFFFNANAQVTIFSSNLETWTGNVPVGLSGSKTNTPAANINPYTTSSHSPLTSCKLENTTSTHTRFSTQPLTVTNATTYTVSFWVRGHGDIRLGLFDGRSTSYGYATYNAYNVINSSSWTQITETIAAAADTSKAEFIFSFRNTNADIDHLQIDDITITRPGTANPTITINTPADGATVYSADVPIAFNVSEFVVGNPGAGIDGHIHYSVDGGTAVMQYTTLPIMLTGLSAGNHQVILQLVDNTHNPLTPNIADTVNFTIDLTLPNPQTIYNIQHSTGSPANSSQLNLVTTTSGIVTATCTPGYFVQDGTGLWNGIYVYDNLHFPAVGDDITVTGTIKEYFGFTEFTDITGLTIHSSGNTLPAPVAVTGVNLKDTVVGEAYEGVLVKITNAVCSNIPSNFATYGEWTIFGGDSCHVDDLIFHYTPTLNTHYDITGVVYLGFHNYYIEPRSAADVQINSGITELSQNNISIYPNPVSTTLFVNEMENISSIEVADITGRIMLSSKVNGESEYINMSSLSNGTYFVRFVNNGTVVSVKSIVKN